MRFASWLNTFIEEKGIDRELVLEVEKKGSIFGTNYIPLEVLIEAICNAPKCERDAIKKMIIKIDFFNGNVLDCFLHLAQAIAI